MPTTRQSLMYLMRHERDAAVAKSLLDDAKSFSQLMQETGLKYNAIMSRILHRLSKYGLVYQVYRRGSEVYSLYTVTPVGKKILGFYSEIEDVLNKAAE